jgi:hypothetical protein
MNERIKELAEQAVEETHQMMIMEFKNFESKLYEKFAELIVKECVSVMYEDDGATHHCELLFTHFGVDE